MGSKATDFPSAGGGGCAAWFRGVGSSEPDTSFRVSNHQVSRFPSCRVLYKPPGNGCWRFSNSPSSRFLSQCKPRERRKDATFDGRGVVVRADKAAGDQESEYEIRVCTHRSCRQLGSPQTLDVLRSLAPPNVTVESCGCLGKCGSGPNLVIFPAQLVVSHCNTPVHAARLLELQCGVADPDSNLKALGLKERGNNSFQLGEHEKAEQFYSEAIALNPSGGLHFIYGNRSAVRLARGDFAGALDDAEQALCIAPLWPAAHLRRADACVQLGDFENAHMACSSALQLDPSLRRSKSFQAKIKQIAETLKLVSANA